MKNKNLTIVLIPDGESKHTINVIRCFSSIKTFQIHILSSEPQSTLKYSRHIKSFISYKDDAPHKQMEAIKAAIIKTNA